MRLIVLDTNVIVSARLSPGGAPAALVIDYVLSGRVQAVTSPSVIQEYIEVVHQPKFARFAFPPPWLEQVVETSLQLPDPTRWPHALPDPKDAIFLALAKASGAWLVTGNLKHFPESVRDGVTVIGPGEYLEGLGATLKLSGRTKTADQPVLGGWR